MDKIISMNDPLSISLILNDLWHFSILDTRVSHMRLAKAKEPKKHLKSVEQVT